MKTPLPLLTQPPPPLHYYHAVNKTWQQSECNTAVSGALANVNLWSSSMRAISVSNKVTLIPMQTETKGHEGHLLRISLRTTYFVYQRNQFLSKRMVQRRDPRCPLSLPTCSWNILKRKSLTAHYTRWGLEEDMLTTSFAEIFCGECSESPQQHIPHHQLHNWGGERQEAPIPQSWMCQWCYLMMVL